MIQPKLKDDAFLADVQAAGADGSRLHLWWLGQSGYLVLWRGRHVLIDPYLSDSLTRKYADTDKPHVRMTARVIAPEQLDFIDVVTSSHNHTDHLDGETVIPLMRANPDLTVVVPEANREFAADRFGVSPERLTAIDAGARVEAAGFTCNAVPAAHEQLDVDGRGRHPYLGYVIEAGPQTIYHSGDTLRYDGMAERLRAWEIDIAILPINGRDPKRGVAGNLSGPQAVKLGRDIGAEIVVPCHYEMFEFNTVPPDEFVECAQAAGQGYRALESGERLTI
ncbi:MBL fold metallo-hydrolase [Candidatus Poribacteria bacterium]|nr:MBL fold metallo-hydrolase [Candidatus Poribacteria bacterium]MBT5532362.1 MBL fold metallo-hydrolase [Candidatus Poribacteria bacterium]MBT5712821.1 MBL fold metallo-hydrolase [Candidatus Poribacteria bacterium]MBT7808846.1 MBL fold metallo-hydrolase [Candidatus Poribacteria bacterium]